MNDFEQSDLEKQTGHSHDTIYQNAIHHKERENAFKKKIIKCGDRMDKLKSFVFARQYRNCFSRRINALVLRN